MVERPGDARRWSAGVDAGAGERVAAELPTGVIVGSAVIENFSQRDDGMWQWHLVDVERAKTFRKPKKHPQPVWFEPF